jgi:CRP-like cAMP-binding protein
VSPRQRIFYEIFPNEVFGETEFFDGALTLGRVSVLSKSAKYVRIPRDVALTLGNAQPRMFLELAEILAQRSRGLAAALTAQATVPILARIAHVLLPYAMPEQGLSSVLPTLLNVTQAQIAASAGTVKEVAARAIAELEARSLLRRERGHIRYLDRQGLLDLIRDLA